MYTPELHSHWVIYELAAGEVELLGQSLHGWFIAWFHWPAAHEDNGRGVVSGGRGGGSGGAGPGGGAGSERAHR